MSERADAVRNRAAVLRAAETLFRSADADRVTLARIAQAAGVGKATVLRHFGSLTGMVEAVLAPRTCALREAARSGPPPLGPGGPPEEALHSFLDALFDFVRDNRALIRALEHRSPDAYYANPASQWWLAELRHRLHAARPSADSDYLAHALFTALRADVMDYLRTTRGMSPQRLRQGLHSLVPPPPPN
ncbi:TetR/AcrR family transcriptional regulator [Streptomyces sp. RS10V-4]|uniref:TetR/AcrR family transcriptional regulator n=1 Tax=Streptomyces rhizoryzae TaxID=2932493 RepID=UPI00200433FE|nr:TetR/AcrR family transcriptional regulator [Streptomyces rhizoryzae]MCK7626093.1 TetR/AcrR family transcriptional regulator [Streptomyces rhizoryzae]